MQINLQVVEGPRQRVVHPRARGVAARHPAGLCAVAIERVGQHREKRARDHGKQLPKSNGSQNNSFLKMSIPAEEIAAIGFDGVRNEAQSRRAAAFESLGVKGGRSTRLLMRAPRLRSSSSRLAITSTDFYQQKWPSPPAEWTFVAIKIVSMTDTPTTRLETDILILGAGGSGLFAAPLVRQVDPSLKITIAVMGRLGKCGCTRMGTCRADRPCFSAARGPRAFSRGFSAEGALRLRALITTTPERANHLPDVPTAREAGSPQLEAIVGWSALYGQRKGCRRSVRGCISGSAGNCRSN